jgi:hypothetical protein
VGPQLGPEALTPNVRPRQYARMPTAEPGRRTGAARGDHGQTSVEYLGAIALVVALVSALLIGTTGIGGHVSAGIQAALCRIGGGSCTVSSILHAPNEECEVYTHAGEISADVVLFSVDVGGGAKLTLSKTIDPDGKTHWYVEQAGDVHGGADLLVGEDAHLGDLGEGVSAEVKALATAGGGRKMSFSSEGAAREFMTAAAHEPVKDALTGWDPTGIAHWLADKIDGHSYHPPAPKEYLLEAGGSVEGSLDAKAGVGGAGASAGVSGVLGVKVTPQDGSGPHRTVYLKLTAKAGAELGLLDAVKAEGGAESEVVVGIEYDGKGQPVKATLEAAGTLKAGIGPDGDVGGEGTIAQLAGFTAKGAPSAGISSGAGVRGKISLTMDLEEPGNAAALADALHSLGVPVLQGDGSVPPPGAVDSLRGLYGRFDGGADGTTVTVTTAKASERGGKIGVKGGDVLTFGAEAGLQFTDTRTTSGYYYSPGEKQFVKWQQCSA